MTVDEFNRSINLLLLGNSALAMALVIIIFIAFVIISGLAGASDLESCLKGVC